MARIFAWTLYTFTMAIATLAIVQSSTVDVKTRKGHVRGTRKSVSANQDVCLFFGIPYAKPPVGNLRFARPEEVESWSDIRDASKHGHQCIQYIGKNETRIEVGNDVLKHFKSSEDCLYLDIYAPSAKGEQLSAGEKKAVMFYIHGGGFDTESGALYNFENLAQKDVVVVSINYRLGIFGFLSNEDDVMPGNYGMLDMVMALDWVKANIDNFGGDPDKITLFGGDSGGTAVALLSLSPLSRDKFKQAIMQSGSASNNYDGVRNVNSRTDKNILNGDVVAMGLTCTLVNKTEMLKCLRRKSTDEILKQVTTGRVKNIPNYIPTVEQTFGFLPNTPIKLLEDPSLTPKPTLRGFNKDDGSVNLYYWSSYNGVGMSVAEEILRKDIQVVYNINKDDLSKFDRVKTHYNFSKSSHSRMETLKVGNELYTDFEFRSPAVRDSILYSKNKAPSYMYQLDRLPSYLDDKDERRGVSLGSERGYVLDLPKGSHPYTFPNTDVGDKKVAEFVSTLWTNFAKFGNPTPKPVNGISWKPFVANTGGENFSSTPTKPCHENTEYPILHISESSAMSVLSKKDCNNVNFWSAL